MVRVSVSQPCLGNIMKHNDLDSRFSHQLLQCENCACFVENNSELLARSEESH